MKKILAVLIAISLIATMAFAATPAVSVDVKASGDVVAIDDFTAIKATKLLVENADEQEAWNPPMWGGTGFDVNVDLTTADEKAGASIMFYNDIDYKYTGSLWVKPIDMLKLSFFSATANIGANRNDDKYGKISGEYGIDLTPVAGLTVKAVLGSGLTFDKAPAGGALVSYSNAAAGTIKVSTSFGATAAATEAKAGEWELDKETGKPKQGDATPAAAGTRWQVAAGYASPKIADMVSFNVLWQLDDKDYVANNKILENATLTAGPVTVFEEFEFFLAGKTLTSIPADVKVSAAFGAASCAVEAEWASIKEAGKLTVTPSASYAGTCGAAGWSLGLEVPVAIDNGAKVGLSVPYSVSLSF